MMQYKFCTENQQKTAILVQHTATENNQKK